MEQRGISGAAGWFLLLLVAGLVVVGAVIAIGTPAARGQAESERVQSEALAYQVRAEAETRAAAERANIRQMERDAAHQRAMDALPYVVFGGGGGVLALAMLLVAWDLRSQRRAETPALLWHLERQRLDQVQLWRAIAALERRGSLPAGRGDVTIYGGEKRE